MVGWFGRKKSTTTTPLTTAELQRILDTEVEETEEWAREAQSQVQKLFEIEEGLRYIVAQTDLDDKTLKIRKNAISELLEEEIKVIQAELVAVNKIAEVIKESEYEKLLQQAGTQDEIDTTLADFTQDLRATDEATGSTRKDLVKRAKQSGLEYKRLAKDLNKKVNDLKTLAGSSNAKLIKSERAHVAGLINMLTSHTGELNKINNQLKRNPNLQQVQQAKQDILNILTRYDARTESARLNEIREENAEVENNLKRYFKETGAIEDLQKQLQAKLQEIEQIVRELRANTNLIVL